MTIQHVRFGTEADFDYGMIQLTEGPLDAPGPGEIIKCAGRFPKSGHVFARVDFVISKATPGQETRYMIYVTEQQEEPSTA